ncbi:MAG: 2TM domain-containing protein [Caldilineaceae bacterium]
MTDQREYERIEKKVEEKLGVYIHLAVYLVINLFLIALNLSLSPDAYWFQWPLIGWGIGLLFHVLGVFVFGEGTAIKKRMLEDEMRKEGLKP